MRIIPRARISYCDGSNAPGRRRAYVAARLALLCVGFAALCVAGGAGLGAESKSKRGDGSDAGAEKGDSKSGGKAGQGGGSKVRDGQSAEQPESKFMRETEAEVDRLFLLAGSGFDAQLGQALFDEQPPLERAAELARKGEGETRAQAGALAAKLERVCRGDPGAGLERLAKELLGSERAKDWKQAFDAGRAAALAEWKSAADAAKRDKTEAPARPGARLFAPLPPVREWRLDGYNQRCATEAGQCLLGLGERQAALAVFKSLGERHHDDVIAILAEEGGGDVFMTPGNYAKAAELYGHAIAVCRHCVGYLHITDYGEIANLQKRIEYKLAQAKRLADIEAYGPGYCAYRECQRKRCLEKNFPAAYFAYEQLARDFPQTVFSEAAVCYRVKCLLELAEPENAAKAREAVAALTLECTADAAKLKQAEQDNKDLRRDKERRQALREALAAEQAELERLQKLPIGKVAAGAADKLGAEFLSDKAGLYRGETLVDLATYAFERKLDQAEAERRYAAAWEWLEGIGSHDAALEAYAVPERARQVSQPPQRELTQDRLGNVGSVTVDPLAICNRKTCPWYLNDLREKCALALGFLRFVREDAAGAVGWYAKVPELDEETQYLERQGEWSNYARLKWGAEHGYLNAYPAELKQYSGRQRFVVLLADFYYCTQRFERAEELARRLLAGEFGKLDPKQDDYPQYLLAACKHWERDRKGAYALCVKMLDEKQWTVTQDRAAFTAANLSWYIADEQIIRDGMALLRTLAESKRDNPYVHRARLVLGVRLLSLGEIEEGGKWLSRVKKLFQNP